MKILVIAPQSNINNLGDWVATAQGNRLTVLNNTVTVREVLSTIANGRWQIVHFATHGCPTALRMSDGEIPDHLLADAFRASGTVDLVVLGACASISLGAELYKAGVPRVVAWRVEVTDQAAIEWARTFYSSLHMSRDIWDATQTASAAVERLDEEPPIYLNGRLAVIEAEVRKITEAKERQVANVPRWLLVVLAGYGAALLALLLLLMKI